MRAGVLVGVLLSVAVALFGAAQSRPAGSAADWPMYRHDLAGTGYSRLTHITPANVATLTQAWTYRLQSDGAARRRA